MKIPNSQEQITNEILNFYKNEFDNFAQEFKEIFKKSKLQGQKKKNIKDKDERKKQALAKKF